MLPLHPAGLAMALESMPPELLAAIAQKQAGPTAPVDNRRAQIKDAMMQAREGFESGMAATPQTGPQPPAIAPPQATPPPGQIAGAMTQGPFPQRMTPAMEQMRPQPPAFPRFSQQRY